MRAFGLDSLQRVAHRSILEPINARVHFPDPQCATLDHVVPIARGGGHTRANVQAAHLGCNLKKGNRELTADDCGIAQLAELGWGRRRIAEYLGIPEHRVRKELAAIGH